MNANFIVFCGPADLSRTTHLLVTVQGSDLTEMRSEASKMVVTQLDLGEVVQGVSPVTITAAD